MIEADSEIIKPEILKAYVWLQTSDGSIQQVEQEIAMFCPFIYHGIHSGMGSSKNYPIALPSRVSPTMLSLILDYCRFHQVPGRSNKERKSFDGKFVRLGTKRLCEVTSAADSLQLKPLVDLTSRSLARVIEGKSPEEIREIFHLPDDLTEEEKLEPIKNTMDDPRIRLLNRLYARKRKELKERERLSKLVPILEEKLEPIKNTMDDPRIRPLNRLCARKRKELKERERLKNIEVKEDRSDERSVDDLLSFINGGSEDCKVTTTSKNKKKNRKRKDTQKTVASSCNGTSNGTSSSKIDVHKDEESNALYSVCNSPTFHGILLPELCDATKSLEIEDDRVSPAEDVFDNDSDDGIDPLLKKKIDREVEDFARRLNSDWRQRMLEIRFLGQERKSLQLAANGNGS